MRFWGFGDREYRYRDLVSRGLTWPGDISGDLRGETVLTSGSVGQHEVQGLVLAPAESVQPRVHHQSAGAEYFLTEMTEPVQRIRVDADIVAQLLAVQTPALHKGRVDGKPRKQQF